MPVSEPQALVSVGVRFSDRSKFHVFPRLHSRKAVPEAVDGLYEALFAGVRARRVLKLVNKSTDSQCVMQTPHVFLYKWPVLR